MKKMCHILAIASSLVSLSLFAAEENSPGQYSVQTETGKITKGGILYDKWAKLIKTAPLTEMHPAYPKAGKASAEDSWRCKSCHGWDLKGKDGAYGEGKNFTGIKGIKSTFGAPTDKIVAILKDKNHMYGKFFKDSDFEELAFFVSKGQIDMDKVIDPKSKKLAKVDLKRGASIYETSCVKCHLNDGKLADSEDTLGDLARKNPWEVLHKIYFGQVGSKMPALSAFGVDASVDVLGYVQTLPGKTLKK